MKAQAKRAKQSHSEADGYYAFRSTKSFKVKLDKYLLLRSNSATIMQFQLCGCVRGKRILIYHWWAMDQLTKSERVNSTKSKAEGISRPLLSK